jgi:anti-anti-sigma factor
MDINETALANCELIETDAVLRCVLSGRLDTERCGQLHEPVLDRIRASGKPAIFDLAAVTFVASAFLRLCIMASRVVGTGTLSLTHTEPSIKKVFKIAGLDGPIRID